MAAKRQKVMTQPIVSIMPLSVLILIESLSNSNVFGNGIEPNLPFATKRMYPSPPILISRVSCCVAAELLVFLAAPAQQTFL
jgi:hypothetical protein